MEHSEETDTTEQPCEPVTFPGRCGSKNVLPTVTSRSAPALGLRTAGGFAIPAPAKAIAALGRLVFHELPCHTSVPGFADEVTFLL